MHLLEPFFNLHHRTSVVNKRRHKKASSAVEKSIFGFVACRCALSSNLGSTLVNGQLFANLSLRSWFCDRDFLGLEAVVVETVSVSDWGSILHLGLVDFSGRVA